MWPGRVAGGGEIDMAAVYLTSEFLSITFSDGKTGAAEASNRVRLNLRDQITTTAFSAVSSAISRRISRPRRRLVACHDLVQSKVQLVLQCVKSNPVTTNTNVLYVFTLGLLPHLLVMSAHYADAVRVQSSSMSGASEPWHLRTEGEFAFEKSAS